MTDFSPLETALLALWDAVYPLPQKTEKQFDIQEKVAPEVARLKFKVKDAKA